MSKRKTTQEFKEEVFNIVGNEYDVLSEYINNKEKILIKHNSEICNNNEWWIKPNNFLSCNQRCPICSKIKADESHRKDMTMIIEEIKSVHGEEYDVNLDNYINNKSKIDITHKNCGHKFESTLNNFLSKKSTCPICAYKTRKEKTKLNINHVREVIKNITNGEYELVSTEYINNSIPLAIRHTECGDIFYVSFGNFTNGGVRCPCISTSKGELRIQEILKSFNIDFETQYMFDDCVGIKRRMPFDFYLEQFNLCIEYQGRQHYEPVDIFGGQEQFEIQVNNDNIKRNYCKNNNIELLEIPHWDFDNLENILKIKFTNMTIPCQA